MSKKVIVTGATSFIGQALIKILLRQNLDVIGIIRPDSFRKNLLPSHKHLKIIEAKLGIPKREFLKEMYGAEIIYHLGWNSDFENPRFNNEGQLINVDFLINVIKLSKEIGCRKIVSVGSQAECGRIEGVLSEMTPNRPETAYAIAKCKAYESGVELCRKFNINLYWPRLLSAYGPYDKERTMIMSCVKAAVLNEDISFTKCEQIWDYIYVDDVAWALILIAQKGIPEVKYSIASGKGKMLREYIETISIITQNKNILKGIGQKEYAKNQVMYLVGDISRLQKDTGFIPKIKFEDGIQKIIKENYCKYEIK